MPLLNKILPIQELIVKDQRWEGYNLWKYIKLNFPHYTKLSIIKELRLKHILVNNSKSYFQYKLQLGDTISIIVLPPKKTREGKAKKQSLKLTQKKSIESQIIFENEQIILIYKKHNQIVQPDSTNSQPSLELLLQTYLNISLFEGKYKPKFVHRLDKSVSGLLLGAKTAKAHSLLSEALKKREIKKRYRALSLGNCNFNFQKLSNWLENKGKRVLVKDFASPTFKLALSEVKRIKNINNLAYLEINLITGRKNQIRAQLSHIGLPILGDRKYYSEESKKILKKITNKKLLLSFNSKKIALLAFQLTFPDYLVSELNLPTNTFKLPQEKDIIKSFLKSLNLHS